MGARWACSLARRTLPDGASANMAHDAATLVHLQNRFQVMSYSGDHETSHLCPYTFEKGAQGSAQEGLRSKDAFVLRRCQILLASARGEIAPQIAENLGRASQTVPDAIHDFNRRGVEALVAGSSRPKQTHTAFGKEQTQALEESL